MSVNSIAGLPIFEVFANNTIIAGQYNSGDFTISGNKVGIGNPNPAYKLDIRSGLQYLNTSGGTNSTSSGSLMILGQNTRGGAAYHDFLHVVNTLSTATNPQKTFRLNNTGTIEIINSAYTTTIFSLTDAGVLSTPGGGTSDFRFKDKIEYIQENVFETINLFKPAKFEFKNYPNIKRHGFIAQDVLNIKPELVLGDGYKEDGTYGLDYDGILALSVKALQETNAKIETMQININQLTQRVIDLENK